MVEQEVMRGQLTETSEVKVGAPRERETRFAQVKRILAGTLHTAIATNQSQAPCSVTNHGTVPCSVTNHNPVACNVTNHSAVQCNVTNHGQSVCEETNKEEVKPRKRKERHESIGSISQERKVVRSNSEERPLEENKEDGSKHIRRVSSHEDFKKSHPLHERNYANGNIMHAEDIKNYNSPNRLSPHRDPKRDFMKDDDLEHEKRRSSERFSRPLAPRGRRTNFGKKRKSKVFVKTHRDDIYYYKEDISVVTNNNIECKKDDFVKNSVENEQIDTDSDVKSDLVTNFLQLHTNERERSPSPINTPATPALDLSKLHEQIDFTEPIPSSSNWAFSESTETLPSQSVASVRMLLSPRNSIIMTRRIFMDTDIQMIPKETETKNPVEQRIKQISKQINSLKKKIKKFEEDFENQYGYRPSHSDKMDDKTIKKFCSDLNKLRKELKQLKDDPLSAMCNAVSRPNVNSDSTKSRSTQIKDTLTEVEQKLTEKRGNNNRPEKMEDMSNDELMDEKLALQKALLFFESLYGRPSSKEDRDLARPLYDRYRTLKRMIVRSGMTKLNNSASELATIHEHETMDFVSMPTSFEPELEPEKPTAVCNSTDSSDTETSLGENLHSLPLQELIEQQRATNEEKKKLRRSLKEFENDFTTKTGRKLQKDDRLPMEGVYSLYKQAKAKLRLLEALIVKQQTQ